jgi:hypothetical protein
MRYIVAFALRVEAPSPEEAAGHARDAIACEKASAFVITPEDDHFRCHVLSEGGLK